MIDPLAETRKVRDGSKLSVGRLFFLAEGVVAVVFSTLLLSIYYAEPTFWLRGLLTDFVLLHYLILLFIVFQKKTRRGFVLLAGVSASTFILVQLKYVHLRDWFRLSDLLLVNEITLVYSPLLIAAGGLAVVAWIVILTLNLKIPRRPVAFLVLSPALFYSVLLFLFPIQLQSLLNVVHEHKSFRGNSHYQKGVLFSLLWDAASMNAEERRMRAIERSLAGVVAPPIFDESIVIGTRRSVYLILIESFMDPSELAYEYSPDPIDSNIREMLGGSSYSPVYGGGTAQAEFEVLCGVPSFRLMGIVEFAHLRGGSVPCLPNILRDRGFPTRAYTATDPSIFNSGNAYSSLGFSENIELKPDSPADLDWKHLSNEKLFREVKDHVQARREQGPALNYIMTLSGHQPYRLNEEVRPPVIRVKGPDLVRAMYDNLYYTSRSLAEFINWLMEQDPEAIIVALGDHQGALVGVDVKYKETMNPGADSEPLRRHKAPYMIIDRGRVKSLGTISHFEVPHIIQSLLAEVPYTPNRLLGDFTFLRPIREITFFSTREGRQGNCPDPAEPGCVAVEELNKTHLAKLLNILTVGRNSPPPAS